MASRDVPVGILFMILAGLAVTGEMIFSMVMLQKQWPYWRITALSCLMVFVAVTAVLVLRSTAAPARKDMVWVILLGFFSAVYWGIGVLAVQLGVDPGDVAALTSVNIVVAAIMGRVLLHENFRALHMVAVVLSVSGALLIARPSFIFASTRGHGGPWYGYLSAISSGFFQGCFFICGRKAGDVSAGHLTLSALAFSALLCTFLPFMPLVQEASFSVALVSPWESFLWTGVAFLTTISSAAFSCAGAMLCPAAISATVYTASSMFFGYLVQSVFFGSTPEVITVLGACLMLSAVSLMAFASRAANDAPKPGNGHVDQATRETAPSVEADNDNTTFASFIASEFSDFDTMSTPLRFRGRQEQSDSVPPQQVGGSNL